MRATLVVEEKVKEEGRAAAGKIPVFTLLKRGGKVHAVMVSDTKSKTLVGIIEEKAKPKSIYSDTYKSHNALETLVIFNIIELIILKNL